MLILAPMHPVMLVYELDQTEGPELPKELNKFAKFAGDWKNEFLDRTRENAAVRDRIRVDFKRYRPLMPASPRLPAATGTTK